MIRPPFLRVILALLCLTTALPAASLLNVSYDVTREFYKDVNDSFVKHWKATTGGEITIKQSHGGSSKQVRSVIDGLAADVVTMNQATDLDALVQAKLIEPKWLERFPEASSPYTSTIVFVVRKGNPKAIRQWDDLVRKGVEVIIPNPKTSGNGRYSYLAAWGHALQASGGKEDAAREFVKKLFGNVPVLDTGGRGATTTFAQRGIGDVLLTFENEAVLTLRELGPANVEIVTPTTSILAEAPVAVVDRVVEKKGTRKEAQAYLQYLYSTAGQELAAKHHFRPRAKEVLAKYADRFPSIKMLTIEEIAGGWTAAQAKHFNDGGIFDQIYIK